MKAVLMAGGRGTRISSSFRDIPKPLIPVEGKPILARTIESLAAQGFREIIITVSHLAAQIIHYFGDGSRLGVKIQYYIEEEPLGNAGALLKLQNELKEDFLLLNADVLFDIDIKRFVHFHQSKGGLVTLFTHPNDHPFDSGILLTDDDNAVLDWLAKEDDRPKWFQNQVNAGIHIINPCLLSRYQSQEGKSKKHFGGEQIDLDRQLLKPLCGTGEMFCYQSSEYVKDMGTPERYEEVCADLKSGLVARKNLKRQQRAIFLDRDGTINKYLGFLRNIDDFELLSGVAEALVKIHEEGYLAIVVTNQPVIARGEVTSGQLREIHNKMETLLGARGAYVDGIYYCPHHPDKGYDGEISALKIHCDCRKPKPGMLLEAAKTYNINLEESWMIGDDENDILAGKAAGCRTALIGSADYGQEKTVSSLFEFAEMMFQ